MERQRRAAPGERSLLVALVVASVGVFGALISIGVAGAQAEGEPKVYWSDVCSATIERANRDGTDVATVVSEVSAFDLAIDASHRRLYWNSDGTIQRAQLDGSGAEDVVSGAGSMALDPADDGFYYVSPPETIWRSRLDGSGPAMLLSSLSPPAGIAVDPEGGKIYWTEPLVTKFDPLHPTVRRANLDGSAAEGLIDPHVSPGPGPIAVDPVAGKLYWADNVSRRIHRARLDGSGVETLSDMSGDLSLPVIRDLWFDPEGSDLYYVWMRDIMPRHSTVIRWDFDGVGLTEVLSRQGPCISSVAFSPVGEPPPSPTPPQPGALATATSTPEPQALPPAGAQGRRGSASGWPVPVAIAAAGAVLVMAGWCAGRRLASGP